MSSEVKIKNIFIYIVCIIVLFVIVEFFVKPYEFININFIYKFIDNVRNSQKIAPNRLFVNAWRYAQLEYVDETMNGQDWKKWRSRYVRQIKTIEDADIAINSMLTSLNDPYSKFLQSDLFSKQKFMLDSIITGVGILMSKSGDDVIVSHVLRNSSAQMENILPGDIIVAINDVDLKHMSLESIHEYLETSKNKKFKFIIKRGEELITKQLERRAISIDTMSYKITKENIGVITIASIMGRKALIDFQRILLKTNKTKGIIIDLRNNYGGILANAIQMADFILSDKKIVSIESRGNLKLQIYADEGSFFTDKPIVILVNSKTASAAEILAGALQSSAGAILLGENTYGKNSIQQIVPMSNGSGMMITTQRYILPNGKDIHNVGITPDKVYAGYTKKKGQDLLMKEAIKLINKLVENQK